MAGDPGFEPGRAASEAAILPLDQSPTKVWLWGREESNLQFACRASVGPWGGVCPRRPRPVVHYHPSRADPMNASLTVEALRTRETPGRCVFPEGGCATTRGPHLFRTEGAKAKRPGGDGRTRTGGLLGAIQTLSQLSYIPIRVLVAPRKELLVTRDELLRHCGSGPTILAVPPLHQSVVPSGGSHPTWLPAHWRTRLGSWRCSQPRGWRRWLIAVLLPVCSPGRQVSARKWSTRTAGDCYGGVGGSTPGPLCR